MGATPVMRSWITEYVAAVRAVVRSDSELEVRSLWPFVVGSVAGVALGLFALVALVFEDDKGAAAEYGVLCLFIALANAGYVLFVTRRHRRPRPSPSSPG